MIGFDDMTVSIQNGVASIDQSAQMDDQVGPGADESAWMLSNGEMDREAAKRHNAAMYGVETLLLALADHGLDIDSEIVYNAVNAATDTVKNEDWEKDRLTYD